MILSQGQTDRRTFYLFTLYKMKKTENLFSKTSKFDAKNITNKSNVTLDASIFDKIDNGVSIETLDLLQKEHNLKVFKYRTQITIHGLFPKTNGFYVGGYSSIFQNKNKSIGVKWTAIDNEKRDSLRDKLAFLGFSRIVNSQEDFFTIQKVIDENTFAEKRDELKKMYDKIDENLFYGSKDLYLAMSPYGRKYICLDMNINAIYQENVQKLLDGLGYDKSEHEKQKELARIEEEKREKEYDRKEQERKKAVELLKVERDKENEKLAKTYKKEVLKEGLYVHAIIDSPYFCPKLAFRATFVKKAVGRKKARYTTSKFDSLEKALQFTGGYCGDILRTEKESFKVA